MIKPEDVRIEEIDDDKDRSISFVATLKLTAEAKADKMMLMAVWDREKAIEKIKEDLRLMIMKHVYGELDSKISKLEQELRNQKSMRPPFIV